MDWGCTGFIEAREPQPRCTRDLSISAALCRGLIEASDALIQPDEDLTLISAALCRGLIEALVRYGWQAPIVVGFPRLYAAASLKRGPAGRWSAGTRSDFRGFMPRPH